MPALVLILFIATEAVLKSYVQSFLHPVCIAILLLCLLYFFHYFKKNSQGQEIWKEITDTRPPLRWNTLLVAGIILLGCCVRFWKLGSLFDGMTYDEAYKGLDGIAIREFGEHPIFLNWNGGREAMVAYLVAAAQTFFGNTSFSVRIVTAIAGSLSLLFLYLLARTLFNNRVALLATFLMAISKWHIIHSRYGVRAGLYPVFELATLYFLVRGLEPNQKRTGSLLAAGAIGGLGLYTYIAYRIFPFVVLAFLAEKAIRHKLTYKGKNILLAAIISIAIVAPLAKFYWENKRSLTDRMQRTQVWRQSGKETKGPVALVLGSAAKTFGLFTYKGDPIARHNIDQEPMLSPFSTAFFVLGAVLIAIHASKPYAGFLLIYFFLTLLPGILSVGAPNVPRVFGSLPVAFIFVSFGILCALQILVAYGKLLAHTMLLVVLSGNFLTGIIDALVRHPQMLDSLPPKIAALWGMDRDQASVARLANQAGNRCEVYLSPMFFFHSTVEYLTYSKSTHKLITPQTEIRKLPSRDRILLVILQPNEVNPWWLRDDEGKDFYKAWTQIYGMETLAIRRNVRKSYDPPFTKTSDWRLLKMLRAKAPDAKELRFEYFSVVVVKPALTK